MSSLTPPPYRHPGSPPPRPELPEGIVRPDLPPPRMAGAHKRGDLPAWPAWSPFAGMLMTLAIALLAATAIAAVATVAGVDFDTDDPPPGITIGGVFAQDIALVVAALVLARLTAGRPTPAQFGLRLPRALPALGWLVLTWASFIVVSAVWAAAIGISESDDLPAELGADESTTALVAVAVLVCVMAPIAEELFFRGFCFTALRRSIGLFPGALLTGLIFGAIHAGGTNVEFLPPLAFLGLMLCFLYYWTKSLIPCMILHALNNSLALGVSQDWSWQVPLLMLAACLAVLAIAIPVIRSPRLNAAPAAS